MDSNPAADKRTLLLTLLKNYVPTDDHQHAIKTRFLEFVTGEVNCFRRRNLSGHVTGSCWLLDPLKEEVLLTHHKKLNEWLQPGGHADGESDILRVALKEAREESGITGCSIIDPDIFDIDIHEIPEYKGVPAHLHYDVRFVIGAPHKNFTVSDESHDLAFMPVVSLVSDMSMNESLRRMARRWLARISHVFLP